MSRSGYVDDDGDAESQWRIIRWRGAVASAMRGKRGQAFLRETLAALDARPEKRLIADSFRVEQSGEVCTLGAVAAARGISDNPSLKHDPEEDDLDQHSVADAFGIPYVMACEIMFWNDDCGWHNETPEQRFLRVRKYIVSHIGQHRPMVLGDL